LESALLLQNSLSRFAHLGRAARTMLRVLAILSAAACPEEHSLHQRRPASLQTNRHDEGHTSSPEESRPAARSGDRDARGCIRRRGERSRL